MLKIDEHYYFTNQKCGVSTIITDEKKMKRLFILTAIFTIKIAYLLGQCTDQVLNLNGTATVNGTQVTVTSSGFVASNSVYCGATFPYFVGYSYSSNSGGNGSYTFNFSPPISAATLNFSGVSRDLSNAEEVKLFVNGTHYQIPAVGSLNGCDALAILTPLGDIAACAGCSVSGWNGTTINGPINSITVIDTVLIGAPAGSIFSLFICNDVSTGLVENKITDNHQYYPNPFFIETTLQTSIILKDASLIIYNSFGQKVKQIKNISGQTVILHRDNLPSGMYIFHLTQDNITITIDKLVITD
jgi:hypothetical protein